MADIKPVPEVVRQKTVVDIMNLQLTVERQKLELMNIAERKRSNEENIAKSLEKISELEAELAKL